MYLKEKRDENVKGRGCADGRPQQLYINKIETSSPTAALTAIMLICTIDAFEKRDRNVKGRGCANGRSQRLCTNKTETSSPTAALTAIMLTCMINAF